MSFGATPRLRAFEFEEARPRSRVEVVTRGDDFQDALALRGYAAAAIAELTDYVRRTLTGLAGCAPGRHRQTLYLHGARPPFALAHGAGSQ